MSRLTFESGDEPMEGVSANPFTVVRYEGVGAVQQATLNGR